jgi:hypothetical protein
MRRGGCKKYFTEELVPAGSPTEPTQVRGPMHVSEPLCCMFPAEGELTPDEVSKLEALGMEVGRYLREPGRSPGFTELISPKFDQGDVKPIRRNYSRRSMEARVRVC